MNTENIITLQTSDDPEAVFQAALNISNSNNPKELTALGNSLGSENFLSLLDSDEDYQCSPETLNVTGILETLAGNQTPEAEEILVQLTQNPVFLKMLSRVEMLILACAELRPVPDPVLTFWTQQAGPESSSTPLVVEALFTNGTEPAMKLFENMMTNPSYSDSDQTFWLVMYAVPHRDDLYFLEAAARAIQKEDAEKQIVSEWIRVIFDYKAGWYPPQDIPTPPNLMEIEPQAKEKLLQIADHALTIKGLPQDLRLAVKSRLSMYRKEEK